SSCPEMRAPDRDPWPQIGCRRAAVHSPPDRISACRSRKIASDPDCWRDRPIGSAEGLLAPDSAGLVSVEPRCFGPICRRTQPGCYCGLTVHCRPPARAGSWAARLLRDFYDRENSFRQGSPDALKPRPAEEMTTESALASG